MLSSTVGKQYFLAITKNDLTFSMLEVWSVTPTVKSTFTVVSEKSKQAPGKGRKKKKNNETKRDESYLCAFGCVRGNISVDGVKR